MRPILQASILLASVFVASAQQVVAPTPEQVGSARGESAENYNYTDSVETGYRFANVSGNDGKYRSDENFRNGLRLFGGSFSANSKDGHGWLFDEILLTTQGLGGEPYESASLRIQKNKLYRYDMLWRLDEFYNPGLTISDGQHFRDTSRRMLDNDLILFPQSKIQFRFGYSRNDQDGPALSTVQLFDSRGNQFSPFMNVRRLWNEYRIGNDIELAGFRFSWLHAWDNFKDDSSYLLGSSPGLDPLGLSSITGFSRVEPYHGNSPFWRGNLHGERKRWAVNARMTYVGGKRDFVLGENETGLQRSAINRQILVAGNGSRPTAAGDFSITIFPTTRLTIVNNTSAYNTRIAGDSVFSQVNNTIASDQLVYFQFLGIRTITNSTDLTYRLSPMVSFYGGYHYSTRQIRSVQDTSIPAFGTDPINSFAGAQDNHLHSGLAGLRLKPIKPLTITLDGEVSRTDHPFTPLSDHNFHALRGRVQYKAKNFLLSGAYRQDYNTNSVSLFVYSSRARNYSFDASWTPRSWFAFDAGYSKLHLDSVSGIAYFADTQLVNGLNSIYVSNIHAGNFGARFAIKKRADLYVGYTITRDAGNGRATPVPAGTTNPDLLLLGPAQTFPLNFQSPLARVSVRLTQKVRWNVGWQFYNYHEDFQFFALPQNYHAHTGYTSVLWSF